MPDICIFFLSNFIAENNLLSTDEVKANDGVVGEYLNTEFSSPLQVTPLFRSLAAAIPSPKFSESVRNLSFMIIAK